MSKKYVSKKGRPKGRTKVKYTITLDKEIVETLKKHNYKISTLCNGYLKSLISCLQALTSHNLEVPCSSHGMGTNLGSREGRLETRDIKSMYFNSRESFKSWLDSRYCQAYSRDIFNALEKVFNKSQTILDVKSYIEKSKISQRSSSLAFRVFMNYCEDNDLLDITFLEFCRKKVKLTANKGIDSFVPSVIQIKNSLSQIKKSYPKQFLTLYRIMLESGCRFTELKHFILNFDKSKVEVWDEEIVSYRNFYLRGKKSSYFLFITLQTYNKLDTSTIDEGMLNSFQDRMSKNKNIISVKYLRKYHFTLMIEQGVSFEIANWIQGRATSNIGVNHYLEKKVLAIREYKKVISQLKQF